MHCDRCNIDFPEGLHYCKWCGEALVDHPRITSELHTCPSCAVAVQPAWTYCKACGSAVYTQQTPFGNSALLCGACNSYSPFGSRACRVCGASLVLQAPPTVVDRPAFVPRQSGTSGEGAPQTDRV